MFKCLLYQNFCIGFITNAMEETKQNKMKHKWFLCK